MTNNLKSKSLLITTLMLFSTIAVGIALIPMPVSANPVVNSTNGDVNNDVVTGTEIWQGSSHVVNGPIEISEGAQLIIMPGTSVQFRNGSKITVKGGLCAGDASCGATSGSGQITLGWLAPGDPSATGGCQDPTQYPGLSTNQLASSDASCGEGLHFKNTINLADTGLNNVKIMNAYGIPIDVKNQHKYSALLLEGASITASELTFEAINTTSMLVMDFASPTITDSTFTVGVDGSGFGGPAISAFSAGVGILSAFNLESSTFTGTDNGCGQQDGGKSTIWVEDSFIDFESISISSSDYGVYMYQSSGELTNSDFDVTCNGIDVNSHKITGDVSHPLHIDSVEVVTAEGAPITAFDNGLVVIENSDFSGAEDGSGISVRESRLEVRTSTIGPVSGWNGLWIRGSSDVIAENNVFQDIAKEPVLIGEYHYRQSGWTVGDPRPARLHFANNTINNVTGTDCKADKVYSAAHGFSDGEFICPAIHVFMASASIHDNTINQAAGEGLRVTAGIVDVQRNTFEAGEVGTRISHYDTDYPIYDTTLAGKYGSIAYFSENTWNVGGQTYNITNSRVSVQSEELASPSIAGVFPIGMQWMGASLTCEPAMLTDCVQVPPYYSGTYKEEMIPVNFPMSLDLTSNATVFTFNLDKILLDNSPGPWQNQVLAGELVRYRVLAKGAFVPDADVVIKNSHGNTLYNLSTDGFGFTPWIVLPSDFHLDFRGNGNNPDGFVTDPLENSCQDGFDNDGDLLYDLDDDDCANGGREISSYFISGWKFGKGSTQSTLQLNNQVDAVLNLDNEIPSVVLDANYVDSSSFVRTISVTGSAYDGAGYLGYGSDWEATLGHMGTILGVDVKVPGLTWDDAISAVDTSGATPGVVTKYNHPFKTWLFEWDMVNDAEDDYTFEFRAWDGVDYSPVVSRLFKLNTMPPLTTVTSPTDFSSHPENTNDNQITFTGIAYDSYSGVLGSDIDRVWVKITKPDGSTYPTGKSPAGTDWSYVWQIPSDAPSGDYTFELWVSDSDFCQGDVGECQSTILNLNIDNENVRPLVDIVSPKAGDDPLTASENTIISGWAIDNDGDITRVELDIYDMGKQIWLSNAPSNIYDFDTIGGWTAVWDTSNLAHLGEYRIDAKSFDGFDYSLTTSVYVEISNPPDQGNTAPVFNASGFNGEPWTPSIEIFCDKGSSSTDMCGGGVYIELDNYFVDPEGAELTYSIDDSLLDDATWTDDHRYNVITISSDGIVHYDPVSMKTYSQDASEWSLLQVQFVVSDQYSSKAYSSPVNLIVRVVDFSWERVDSGLVSGDDNADFAGQGRPGVEVTARLNDGSRLLLNSTIVDENGNWRMEISQTMLGDGNHDIMFEYSGEDYSVATSLQSGQFEEGSLLWLWIVIGVVVVVVLSGLLVYFFVEIEIDDDDYLEESEGDLEEDPYAWAKTNQPTAEVAQPQAADIAQPVQQTPQQTYPGWIWDQNTNQWVKDPNYPQ